eukprot:12797632-Alexandrium_andersonii.AAC.1
MSASLVGSEMCIRDRRRDVSSCRFPIRGSVRRFQAAAPSSRPLSRTSSPVSYTHLTLPTICSV